MRERQRGRGRRRGGMSEPQSLRLLRRELRRASAMALLLAFAVALTGVSLAGAVPEGSEGGPAILQRRCVQCHGPATQMGGLGPLIPRVCSSGRHAWRGHKPFRSRRKPFARPRACRRDATRGPASDGRQASPAGVDRRGSGVVGTVARPTRRTGLVGVSATCRDRPRPRWNPRPPAGRPPQSTDGS